MGFRKLKAEIASHLAGPDAGTAIARILGTPPRQAVSPLFSLLHSGDERIRWRAVSAMGAVVARMADSEPEAARVVMRRMMWNLNDESGGIGWGTPEAMGEVMARSEVMAAEYAAILVSYIDPSGNYLELPALQGGALWGIGRLAHARPEAAAVAAVHVADFLNHTDGRLRGLAAWALGPLEWHAAAPILASLLTDTAEMTLWMDLSFSVTTVGRLARDTLDRLGGKG